MAMILQFPNELVKEFERLNLKVVAHAEGVTLEVQSTLEQEIRKWQLQDAGIQKIKESMKQREAPELVVCSRDRRPQRDYLERSSRLSLLYPSRQY
jgi:gluconate kinase